MEQVRSADAGLGTASARRGVQDQYPIEHVSAIARHLRNTAEWLRDFEHPTFSSEVDLAKPEPAIYQLCVDTLRVEPSEIPFVDDREAKVSAAQRLGLKAICFQSVDKLASDLKAFDFEILP